MSIKHVLITGAAAGIGLATAEFFHTQGYRVGMADLSLSALEKATEGWNKERIHLLELDVTNFSQALQVLNDFCGQTESGLSVLINNAGILEIGAFKNVSHAQHARTMNVNVMGVINLCQAALPYLKKHPRSTVVNLCSASSDYGIPELASYSASKHAVKALTEALEIEWQQHDIRVCDVIPPFIATNMVTSQQASAKVLEHLGVDLNAEDVVKVIHKQITSPKPHRTVGTFYGLLHRLSNISPFFINRLVMKYLSR